MRIHLIKKATVYQYCETHANARTGFENWLRVIEAADWNEPADILNSFANVDILGRGSNRVIFDVGGNKYRCICSYKFGKKNVHLFIKWIGTHAEYTTLCETNLQYNVTNY